MKHLLPLLGFLIAGTVPLSGWGAGIEPVQVARYSTMAPVPTAAQVDPLQSVISISFPDGLRNVGDALRYLLRRSGYRLATAKASDPAAVALMSHTLPEVHRRLGPITVARALTTLAGPAWRLVVDPVHRLVSFELARRYAAMMGHPALPASSPGSKEISGPAIQAISHRTMRPWASSR